MVVLAGFVLVVVVLSTQQYRRGASNFGFGDSEPSGGFGDSDDDGDGDGGDGGGGDGGGGDGGD